MDEMFKYLSKHCTSTKQVVKLQKFIGDEEFDTDSVKMDAQNFESSNLSLILPESQELKNLNKFLKADSGLYLFEIHLFCCLTCYYCNRAFCHVCHWLYILLLGSLQEYGEI